MSADAPPEGGRLGQLVARLRAIAARVEPASLREELAGGLAELQQELARVNRRWELQSRWISRLNERILSLARLQFEGELPLDDLDDELAGVVAGLNMLGEELQASTEELRRARDAAEASSRAKGRFLAQMGHEIRTPLNGVIGMTQLLLDTPLTREQREHAEIIRNSADALLRVISDMLDLSRIEAEGLALERAPFDVRRCLDELRAALLPQLERLALALAVSVAPEVPEVLVGDVGRIRQVLQGLLDNAMKCTSEGQLVVRVSLHERGPGDVVFVRFEVEDSGTGLPQRRLDRLFGREPPDDDAPGSRFGGISIGVAMCRELVALMDGRMDGRSAPGEGTRYWFTLPLARSSVSRLLDPALSGTRALVLDSDLSRRRVICDALDAWGCRCELVEDGASALAQLHRRADSGDPVGIALLDAALPGVDGHALGRAIKANPQLRGTRLVLLRRGTQSGRAADHGELAPEFAACLGSPISAGDLQQALRVALAPTRRAEDRGEGAGTRLARQLGRPVRVLVAEDNPISQKVALSILHRLGFEARAVSSGEAAVESLCTTAYDAVLMDLQMPGLDGLEATGMIRDPATRVRDPGVPVIGLTGHVLREVRDACLQSGMNDYIAKPVDPWTLAEALERWILRHALGG